MNTIHRYADHEPNGHDNHEECWCDPDIESATINGQWTWIITHHPNDNHSQ